MALVCALCVLLAALWLIGHHASRSGLEQFGVRSAREISETREQLEAEDLDQLLGAHNARRRARGEPELTVPELERRVIEDREEQRSRSEAYMAERELEQLLEATNARRRARGLPERTLADVRREFGADPSPET